VPALLEKSLDAEDEKERQLALLQLCLLPESEAAQALARWLEPALRLSEGLLEFSETHLGSPPSLLEPLLGAVPEISNLLPLLPPDTWTRTTGQEPAEMPDAIALNPQGETLMRAWQRSLVNHRHASGAYELLHWFLVYEGYPPRALQPLDALLDLLARDAYEELCRQCLPVLDLRNTSGIPAQILLLGAHPWESSLAGAVWQRLTELPAPSESWLKGAILHTRPSLLRETMGYLPRFPGLPPQIESLCEWWVSLPEGLNPFEEE